jgi:hypothetical protein
VVTESEIGGDDNRRSLVEPADEMEQELAAGLGKGQISELVQDDKVHPGSDAQQADPGVRCGSRSRGG